MASIDERYEEWKKKKHSASGGASGSSGTASVEDRYKAWRAQRFDLESTVSSIYDRTNTWLKNHSNYLDNYNYRYSGRTGTYEDAYVSDAGDWLSTVTAQKENFDIEASNILSMLDRYGDYLDADWADSVRSALTSAGAQQAAILKYATSDSDYWAQFADENEYGLWQTDQGYRSKYSGKTYEDIVAAVDSMEDGEEKQWLRLYQYDLLTKAEDFGERSVTGWDAYIDDDMRRRLRETGQDPSETIWEKIGRWLGATPDTSLPMGTTSQVIYDLSKDTSYQRPSDNWTMEQEAIFGYLYAADKSAAAVYAQMTNEANNQAMNARKIAAIEDWATKNGWTGAASTLGAIAMMPLSLTDTLNALAEYNARGFVSTSSTPLPGQVSQAITGAISSTLNDNAGTLNEAIPVIGGKGWGDVYQLGVSIAESMITAYTQGSVGTYMVFFGSASSSAMYDAKNRGATDEQAITLGVLSGLAEAAGEAFSVEHLLSLGGASELSGFFTNVLLQAGIEASEEGVTTLLNNFSEQLVMGDKSSFNTMVQQYMTEEGLSEEEAKKKAWKSMANDLAFDMLSGAISGGVSSGLQTGVQTMFVNHEAKQTYGDNAGALVDEALEIGPDNKFAQKMKDRLDSGKSLSGGQLNRLVQQNEKTMTAQDMASIQNAVAQRLTELGVTENVDAIASALAKQAAGQEMSYSEKRLAKQYDVVAGELTGKYKADWTGKIGTHRINAQEYGRMLEADQKAQEAAEIEGGQTNTQGQNEAQAQQVEPEGATVRENRTVAENATVPANDGQMTGKETGKESLQVAEESSEAEAATVTLEDASKKYGAYAGPMMNAYQEGQDVEKFDQAFQAVYDMGRSGVNFSYAAKSATASYLTEGQRMRAYEAGKAAADSKASAKDAKNKAAANGKTGRKKGGVVRGEGVTTADLRKAFHDTRGKAYKALSTIAKVTGVNIVLYKSQTDADGNFIGEQGKYDHSDPGTLYIDINAGLENISDVGEMEKYVLLRTFSHEFTHFIENWNPIQYNEFRKVVFDTLTERGVDVDSLIEAKMDNTGLGYEAASREVVADAMTDILPDSSFVQKLAEEHKTIFNKLLEKLKEFAQNIRDCFDAVGPNDAMEANALKEQGKYLSSIVKLWDEIAVQAVENYQKTVATEKTVQEVNSNERREETREAFLGRAVQASLEVGERGTLAYGFRHYHSQLSPKIQAAKEGLTKLGIPVVVFEQMEGNKDGVTTIYKNDALAIPGVAVFIHKDATVDALEIVGHEGYHYLKGSANRVDYKEVVAANVDFASKAFIDYQQKYVGDIYFAEDVEIGSKEWDTLTEEIYAYITGDIHAGDPNGEVHAFLRDYRAVKSAWDSLIQKQIASEVAASKKETTTTKDAYGFTITDNVERGSLEISFDSKPSDEVRHALKEHKFRWHKVKKVWFGYTDRQTITDALHKAYEAEKAETPATTPEQSDFEKAFWNASQAERDEVVEAIQKNTKITHMAPTEIRESAPVAEIEEVTENGENADNQGAVPQYESDGRGTARLLDEVETGDVQGDGGSGDAVADAGERGSQTGRDGDRSDTQRPGRGSGEGSSQSGDLRRNDGLTAEKLHAEVEEQIQQQSTEQPKGRNFVIGDSLDLPNGEKARYKANVEAIRLVKQLETEGRYATEAEQVILSKYVGWGGLANAFDQRKTEWAKEFAELKELLTDEEYASARGSTLNAHFTDISVIKAMYDGLKGLGFTGGRMLEPSSGVGNFVGAMPADMAASVRSWTMVELDGITGLIGKYLYPNADMRIQGFEKANIPNNFMDVAIGNVPFGNYAIADKSYPKKVTSAIHNYFFAKSLDKVRPGGIVMFITSSYTMNSSDTTVRRYIMQKADLLGAIRLPDTAFKGNAGTEVVTDILVLKKRAENTNYAGENFLEAPYTRPVTGNWNGAYINDYFNNHPEMVLGTPSFTSGRYGGDNLTYKALEGKGSLADQIREAFKNIQGKMDYPAQLSPEKTNFAVERAGKKTKENGLVVKEGKVYKNTGGELIEQKVAKGVAERITGMLEIRDAAKALQTAQQQGLKDTEIKKARQKLNKAYDDFVKKYGFINAQTNRNAIKDDPDRYSILALENWNSETKKATKADIFSKNTIAPNRTVTSAKDVAEGLIVSINQTGGVDAALIAKLTGKTVDAVTRELIDSRTVFKNRDGGLETAEVYLSGNVRAKLRDAEALVHLDADYQKNVDALKAIVPEDVGYQDIFVNPGTVWIPDSVYSDFAAHMLGGRNTDWSKAVEVTRNADTGNYTVELKQKYLKTNSYNTQQWGTSRRSFLDLFDAMLNSRSVVVKYKTDDGKSVVDKDATAAANEKIENIQKEFQEWLWKDESRRTELATLYNETFNSIVTPKYNGDNLTVNGANAMKPLRPHQRNAVQRIIASGGNTLLAHKVGAGKTYEMAAAAMKLKQLGLVKKPMFAVPKSLVAQWGNEFMDFFPTAKLLVAEQGDFTAANRKVFANRIANGDYDAVIVSYEQFERLPISDDFARDLYQEQIDSVIRAIEEAKAEKGGKSLSVKDLEKKRKQLQAKIDKLTDSAKDADNIEFEQLGVDSIFVDEAHNFKNLFYTTSMTNVSGLGNKDGSKRAFDLYTKVRYLQKLIGGRGIVFATATPVMNSMSEMYIMQKYLQPDLLDQLGLSTFDAWAKQFGEVVNGVEIKPSGQGYRVKQSFSRFKNMSELQLLFRNFADVLTDIPGLEIPKMKGGTVNVVVCEPGQFQQDYMKELEKRADNIKNVDPSVDNMLKITSDGRKISYTQRMIDPSLPYEEGCKIFRCADNVLAKYAESKDIKGTQIIFCDMATPKGKSNTTTAETEDIETDMESAKLYDDIKARLIKGGIPAKEIAFIHEADTDAKKKKLFADVNEGKVRVLIGSTGKMGVGMNAQKRIVAIHHLDAPWRPGDVEQRNGRAFRQGNINEEVENFTYVTEGSFDARLWDILERKQNFINQVMNGENVGRETEDTGEVTLSAAEVKALASGSPLIMEQVQLDTDIKKLESLYRAHRSAVAQARQKLEADKGTIATLQKRIAAGKKDVAARVDTYSEGKFSITVGKQQFTDKKEAGIALMAEAAAKANEAGYTTIGKFAGFELRVVKTHEGIKGLISGNQGYTFNTYPGNTTFGINHLIAKVEGMSETVSAWEQSLEQTRKDMAEQEKLMVQPFAKQAELDQKRARYNEVMEILNPKEEQALDSMDEDTVQYQQRKRPDDEKPKKRSRYSETETLFMIWANGSAPVGEVKRFFRFGKVHYYAKTEDGCVELSRAQYNERTDFNAQNIDRRAEREISQIANFNGSFERNAAGGINGDRNAGGAPAVSGQAIGEELRNDARRSVRSSGRSDRRATMTESRIDYLIADSGAGMRTDYAQGWITSINPTDFLNLTLLKSNQDRTVFDNMPGDYGSTINDYDFVEGGLKKETRQTPYLAIDVNTGKVVGHEGRHRMRALEKEGITYAEIKIEFRDSDGYLIKAKNGYGNPLKTIGSLRIFNQRDTGQSAVIHNIMPLYKANRENILQHYGVASDGDIKYQQRSNTLTNREVLELAASELQTADLPAAEKDALGIFQQRLAKLEALQEERAEQGRLYKEQQFGTKVDREAAKQTLNRMKVLDSQIEKAKAEVLSIEDKQVLKAVLQKARKVVEKQQWAHDQEVLKRYRDRRNDAAAIKKYRERLTKDVGELTKWVLHPNNKDVVKHIPDVLKNSVIPFLSSIDFTSKQQLRGGEATKADQEFMKRLNGLKAALKPGTSVEGLYGDYSDLPPNFMEKLQMLIDGAQAIVEKHSGEFVVNQMTSRELKELSEVVSNLKAYIQNFNRFHANQMMQYVHEAGDNTIADLALMKNASDKTGSVSNFVMWQQMRPAYAWERFGAGGKAIYDGLRRGQAKLAFNTKEIQAFAEKAYTEAEVKAWEKEIKAIKLGDDIVKMPVSTIMSFYELSKRPQALGHILGQGIRVATYKANGKKISDAGHMVQPGEVATIIGTLTDRQKEVADKLQKFMQEQGGAWGNYVSVKRFGVELFGEDHYFPINSDGRHLPANADEHPSAASLYALLNMGFTKATTEGANNRIVLYSIFDVFANHMASMAQYNALALPVVDAIKWFNYQQKSEPDEDGHRFVLGSVRDQMDRVYGVPEETRPGSGRQGYAQTFVINILRAFNGTEAQGVPTDSTGLKTLRRYNMAQVAYNFRVVVQQPLAITRAALLVDYASIIKGIKLSPAAIRKNIQEMQKYSGIAAWKSLGFYDVNISRGLTDIIKHKSTVGDKIGEVGMWGAEKADLLTWAGIWSACKEEVIRKQKLTPNSEGFYEAVTQLFEDVIYRTQVVDSVLTKNEYMRSKGFFARAMSSFMSEPTTTASMLINAYDKYHTDLQKGMTHQQAWKKNGRMIVRTAYVYGVSAVLLAAVQAAADAMRDDDDYQEWYEKWLEAFGGNLVDEIMPINKLPILSDFYEVAKELLSVFGVDTYGNAPTSVFMQWYDSLVKGTQIMHDKISGEDTNYTWYGGAYKLLQAVSGMTGLPMAAATREIVTAWNNIVGAMAPSLKVKTYDPGEKNEIKYAYQDGWITEEEAREQLLEQGLVDNEDEAYWTVQGWEAGDGYSRYGAIYDAVRNGGDFDAAMTELTSHGIEETTVYSRIKSQVGQWYQGGEITKQQTMDMLTKYTDLSSEEITATVNKWSCKVVTGIAYDDIADEFLAGNITEARAKEMYMRYGGLTEKKAKEKVHAMAFQKEHPECDGISYAAVEKYEAYCEEKGVEAGIFYDVWKYKNADGVLKADAMDYIHALDLSRAQKNSLYYAMGWAQSELWKAPWN